MGKYIKLFEEVSNEIDNRIELSTTLIKIFEFYFHTGGNFDNISDSMFDGWVEDLENGQYLLESDNFWDFWDAKAFSDKAVEMFKLHEDDITKVFQKIDDNIKKVEVISAHHPASYNYGGDSLNFDIIAKDINALKDSLISKLSDIDGIDKKLHDKFKSYSGFTSFMPQSLEEVIEYMDSDIERGIAAALTILISEEDLWGDFKEIEDDVIEYIHGNTSYTDFFTKDGISMLDASDKLVNSIVDLYRTEKTIDEAIEHVKKEVENTLGQFIEPDIIEKVVKRKFVELGKGTIDMFDNDRK